MEKKNTHIAHGLITGVVMAITGLIIYLTGVAFKPGMQYVAYIPFFAGIMLNAIAFSKAHDGFVTFGNVFGSCFKATMIITLVMVLWSFLVTIIFPGMKAEALQSVHDAMAKKNNMTDEQMDMTINMTKKYWNVILIAGAVFGNLVSGIIFSLIASLIAKKKGPQPFVASNP